MLSHLSEIVSTYLYSTESTNEVMACNASANVMKRPSYHRHNFTPNTNERHPNEKLAEFVENLNMSNNNNKNIGETWNRTSNIFIITLFRKTG